jgi:hypothetical protein
MKTFIERVFYISVLLMATFSINGCGGGDGGEEYYNPYAVTSSIYTGDVGSSLKVCNSSYDYYIIDVRSNPAYSSEGPNRISYDIEPGTCHTFYTTNCDVDYFLDVTYDDGNYWSGEYFRGCGYEYVFDFVY